MLAAPTTRHTTLTPGPDASPIVLDRPQVQALITARDARCAVEASLLAVAGAQAVLPDELAMALPAGEVHVKGGHLLTSKYAALKVASGFPHNSELGLPVNNGFTLVLNADTGELVASLLENGWLTEMRTGAAGAVAAQHLARPDAAHLALIGAGAQARFQLQALREVRNITRVRIWNRTAARAHALAAELSEQHDIACCVPETPRAAIAGADIVVTGTASRDPLIRADWLEPGIHITAMGSDFSEKQELDNDVLGRADLVVADDVGTCSRVGELHHALAAGFIDVSRVLSLADVVGGKAPGRTSPDQITVADQCGLGVYDAAIADTVLARYLASQ